MGPGEPFYSEDMEEPLRGDPKEHRRFFLSLWVILGLVAIVYLTLSVIGVIDNKEESFKFNKNMSEKETFACAINCMDGRVQDVVKDYMKKSYGVNYVDMITEPGPDKILAEHTDAPVLQDLKKRIDISVNHHGAKVVAIVGHFGCAGNPVDKENHISDLKEAKKTVESFGFNVEIILLWVDDDFKKAELIH